MGEKNNNINNNHQELWMRRAAESVNLMDAVYLHLRSVFLFCSDDFSNSALHRNVDVKNVKRKCYEWDSFDILAYCEPQVHILFEILTMKEIHLNMADVKSGGRRIYRLWEHLNIEWLVAEQCKRFYAIEPNLYWNETDSNELWATACSLRSTKFESRQ